jgi:hypothetical protein
MATAKKAAVWQMATSRSMSFSTQCWAKPFRGYRNMVPYFSILRLAGERADR